MPVVAIGVAEIVTALVALLLVLCGAQLVHYLVVVPLRAVAQVGDGILSQIPFIGSLIGAGVSKTANAIAGGIEFSFAWAQAATFAWANTSLQAMANAMFVSGRLAHLLWDGMTGAVEDAVASVVHVVSVDVPALETFAVQQAQFWASKAEGEVISLAFHIRADMASLLDSTFQRLSSNLYQVDARLTNSLSSVAAGLGAAINGVEIEARGLVRNATDLLTGAIVHETSRAVQAERAIAEQAHTEVSGVWQHVQELVGGEIGSVVQGLTANDAAIAAAAAAATGVVALELTRFLEECGHDLCNNLGPLAKLMPSVDALLEEGALFALLALCMANPSAGAAAVMGVVEAPQAAARGLIRAVVGG